MAELPLPRRPAAENVGEVREERGLVALARRRPWAFFAAFALLALLCGLGDRAIAHRRAEALPELLRGRWIWAPGPLSRPGLGRLRPTAFFLARDFTLDEPPEAATLALLADENYVLWVNGRRVGSGGYDGRADVYPLADWLEPGPNRLTVELRSASGAGGLLAGLEVDGRVLLRSDESWRVVRDADAGLLRGWRALAELSAERPLAWSTSPTGHWWPENAVDAMPTAWPSQGLRPAPLCPAQLRHTSAQASWTPIAPSAECRIDRVGELSLWDFGREVEGFLEIGLDPADPAHPGLLFVTADEPKGNLRARRPDAIVLRPPGAWLWTDAHARRFRYVALIGSAPYQFVRLLPVDGDQARAFAPPPPPDGVFGLKVPDGTSRLEEEIWTRLEGHFDPDPPRHGKIKEKTS